MAFAAFQATFGPLLLRAAAGGFVAASPVPAAAGTIALWLFDEQQGIYPGLRFYDAGPNERRLS